MSDVSGVRKPRCPLCDAPVEGDEELRGHLATVHELEDDPGTVTQLEALERIIPGESVVATAEPLALRVHDPRADDDRWRPIAIGFGGLVLLVMAVVALSIGKGLGL